MSDRIYNLPKPSTWMAFDLETSGLDPKKHQIVQLGMISGDEDLEFDRLITFDDRYEWDDEAQKRHGRTRQDLLCDGSGMAEVEDAALDFVAQMQPELIVTYNGTKLDLEFLAIQMPRLYAILSERQHFDVYAQLVNTKLGYSAYDGNHGLDEMCRILLGIRYDKAPHDALSDAADTLLLLRNFYDHDVIWSHLLRGEEPKMQEVAADMRSASKASADYERYKVAVMAAVEDLREQSGEKDGKFRVGCVTVYYKSGTRRMPRIPKGFDVPESWYKEENTSRKNVSFYHGGEE